VKRNHSFSSGHSVLAVCVICDRWEHSRKTSDTKATSAAATETAPAQQKYAFAQETNRPRHVSTHYGGGGLATSHVMDLMPAARDDEYWAADSLGSPNLAKGRMNGPRTS